MHSKPVLETLLPHRPPMLLLTTVLSVDEERACCEAAVSEEMPFIDRQGNLPGWVGIELMAQTIAVWGGQHAKSENRAVGVGMLLGCRKYISKVSDFPAGARLIINAEKIIQDGNMGVFHCTISCSECTVAEAQLSTYLPDAVELKQILERSF